MAHKIYPHGGLEKLAPNLWMVRGGLSFPLHRNMVVARLASGDLVLHSLVALDETGIAGLEALGRPAWGIVPHAAHKMDAAFYRDRLPGLRQLCPAAERPGIAPHTTLAGTVEDVLPGLGITVHPVPGVRLKECVYEVPLEGGGRALIANDLFGNSGAWKPNLGGRILGGLSGVPGGFFGIPRLYRMTQVKDMAAVKAFVAGLAAIPDVRVLTVSHGDPVTGDVAAKLRAIAA